MGLADIPGLAGYFQQDQINRQNEAGQLNKLAQVLGIQSDAMKMQKAQKELDDMNIMSKLLSAGGTAPPAAASGYSTDVANAFNIPRDTISQAKAAPSYADRFLAAAQATGNPAIIDNALKMSLEFKKLSPKYASDVRTVMINGKPAAIQMADDGTWKPMGEGVTPAEKLHFADNGQFIQGLNPYTGASVGSGIQKQQTPDSLASNRVTMRGQDMVDDRKREELQGAEAAFTPAAIENAAARYNIDGTLPPMGMGKTGAMGRSAILNRAAELASQSGLSGDEQRIQQIGNAANKAALTKLQSQQTMVGAFEKNFVRNADITLQLSEKAATNGVPVVTGWLNAGKRSVMGDPNISAYDASIKATVNEYAKIISGSMGNTAMAEGEIKKVESLLNSAQTPAQVNAVITLMKRETENRMKGFDEEKANLIGSMTGRKPQAASAAHGDVRSRADAILAGGR